jgi:predicted TIM-barrel fold metal-dependent hydrolase
MQPFDVPSTPQAFERIVDQIGSESMLCFATDYPHWQADSADQALPPLADGEHFRGIMAGNARALYGIRLGG